MAVSKAGVVEDGILPIVCRMTVGALAVVMGGGGSVTGRAICEAVMVENNGSPIAKSVAVRA